MADPEVVVQTASPQESMEYIQTNRTISWKSGLLQWSVISYNMITYEAVSQTTDIDTAHRPVILQSVRTDRYKRLTEGFGQLIGESEVSHMERYDPSPFENHPSISSWIGTHHDQ